MRHSFEEERGGGIHEEQLSVGGFEKARLDAAIEEMQEAVIVAVDVENADGFLMEAELCPGEDLKEFIEGSIGSGQGDEGIGEIGHQRFAFMHGFDDVEPGQFLMGNFFFDQLARDDANDFAAAGEHGIGDEAHQADMGSAVDERMAEFEERIAQLAGG